MQMTTELADIFDVTTSAMTVRLDTLGLIWVKIIIEVK